MADNPTTDVAPSRTFRMNDRLPGLYIPWPQCEHCGEDVQIEDGEAHCESCLIRWDQIVEDRPGRPDRWVDGTDVPCVIVVGAADSPWSADGKHFTPGPPLPCVLPSGHEGKHLCPHDVVVRDNTPAPHRCSECRGTDPDACVTCITEAGVWLADEDNTPASTEEADRG